MTAPGVDYWTDPPTMPTTERAAYDALSLRIWERQIVGLPPPGVPTGLSAHGSALVLALSLLVTVAILRRGAAPGDGPSVQD